MCYRNLLGFLCVLPESTSHRHKKVWEEWRKLEGIIYMKTLLLLVMWDDMHLDLYSSITVVPVLSLIKCHAMKCVGEWRYGFLCASLQHYVEVSGQLHTQLLYILQESLSSAHWIGSRKVWILWWREKTLDHSWNWNLILWLFILQHEYCTDCLSS